VATTPQSLGSGPGRPPWPPWSTFPFQSRFTGIDGPRWFLRAVFHGPAAYEPESAGPLEGLVRDVIVVRGGEAMAPRELLALKLPQGAAEQPVERAATLEDVRAEVLTPDRLNAMVFGGFALVALGVLIMLPIIPRTDSGLWLAIPLVIAGIGLGLLLALVCRLLVRRSAKRRVTGAPSR